MEPDAMGCGKCIINGFIYCDYDYDCENCPYFADGVICSGCGDYVCGRIKYRGKYNKKCKTRGNMPQPTHIFL